MKEALVASFSMVRGGPCLTSVGNVSARPRGVGGVMSPFLTAQARPTRWSCCSWDVWEGGPGWRFPLSLQLATLRQAPVPRSGLPSQEAAAGAHHPVGRAAGQVQLHLALANPVFGPCFLASACLPPNLLASPAVSSPPGPECRGQGPGFAQAGSFGGPSRRRDRQQHRPARQLLISACAAVPLRTRFIGNRNCKSTICPRWKLHLHLNCAFFQRMGRVNNGRLNLRRGNCAPCQT